MAITITKPAVNISERLSNLDGISLENFKAMDATFSGSVGIGTADPQRLLHLSSTSNIGIRMEGPQPRLEFGETDSTDQNYAIRLNGGDLIFDTRDDAFSTIGETMRLKDTGNVGIGTNAPNKLGWDANARVLTHFGIRRSVIELGSDTPVNNDVLGQLSFMSAGTTKASIRTVLDGSSNGSIVFDTEGTEALRITDNGNIVFPAGHGIDFNASQSGAAGTTPSSTATLNDYEEGTWTPEFGGTTGDGSMTYSNQVGYYTKIGNLVTVNCRLTSLTVTTSPTGSMVIRGLPFTVANDVDNYHGASIGFSNSWATAPNGAHSEPSSTFLYLKVEDVNGNLNGNLGSIAVDDDIILSMTYRAA